MQDFGRERIGDPGVGVGVKMDPADEMVPFPIEQGDDVDERQPVLSRPGFEIAHQPGVNQEVEFIAGDRLATPQDAVDLRNFSTENASQL